MYLIYILLIFSYQYPGALILSGIMRFQLLNLWSLDRIVEKPECDNSANKFIYINYWKFITSWFYEKIDFASKMILNLATLVLY